MPPLQLPQKNTARFKSGQKWPKIDPLDFFPKVKTKSPARYVSIKLSIVASFFTDLERGQRDAGAPERDGDANVSGLLHLRKLEPESGAGISANSPSRLLQHQNLLGRQVIYEQGCQTQIDWRAKLSWKKIEGYAGLC